MRFFRTLFVAAGLGALVIVGTIQNAEAQSAQTTAILNNLFAELKKAKSPRSALEIEQRIWQAWYQSGNAEIDSIMRRARVALAERNMKEAIELADKVVKQAPDYSEGWNFRATALYIDNQLDASMADVVKVLSLEPRHFGALSGSALIFLRKGKKRSALKAIKHALDIHPYLRGAAAIISQAGGLKEDEPI
ncbi:MAG: hypothetical protein AAGF81_04280 [Pseudomonadota bacterium]